MLKYLFILIAISSVALSHPNELEPQWKSFTYGLKGGVIYGGPIPQKMPDNYKGSAVIGPYFAIYFDYKLSDNFSFHPELSFSIKGVTYKANYRKDTIVDTEVGGQQGKVPTFYNAYLDGEMSLNYLDVPLFITYKLANITDVFFGFQGSFLLGGNNVTNARVVVGEGGFYDDFIENYDSYKFINSIDFAFCIGGSYNLSDELSFSLYGSRSFVPLYKEGTMRSKDIDTGDLFNTYFVCSVAYLF